MAFKRNQAAENDDSEGECKGTLELCVKKAEQGLLRPREPSDRRHCAFSFFRMQRLIKNANEISHRENKNKLADFRRLKLAKAEIYPALDRFSCIDNKRQAEKADHTDKNHGRCKAVEHSVINLADDDHRCKTDRTPNKLTFEVCVRT